MGNCLRRFDAREPVENHGFGIASTAVRIRITKRQLEELLRRAETKGFDLDAVMEELMCMGHVDPRQPCGGHWRPTLCSIAEEQELDPLVL
ncbi:hypothetical protein HPP92_015978 [Vanilla planifolia]|uniref:Uncharacterized protein n=1 Tax=Vanilla planifolia TaxID=51239 RepID=A0A835QNB1_VANPL|nr:hypothetical protein HPP92_015978 [Vanilla planifolia]